MNYESTQAWIARCRNAQKMRSYRASNLETCRAYARDYFANKATPGQRAKKNEASRRAKAKIRARIKTSPDLRAEYLEKSRDHNLRSNYGISAAQYDAMLFKQKGVCAVCSSTCKTGRRLAVDHNHATGVIRGLLCAGCNRSIGGFGESVRILESAIAYLKSHGGDN